MSPRRSRGRVLREIFHARGVQECQRIMDRILRMKLTLLVLWWMDRTVLRILTLPRFVGDGSQADRKARPQVPPVRDRKVLGTEGVQM
mmetsp:Transcript_8916/g.17960  ORF Transcript_8916/g.17960 Transcript_8916/m.17960 type:complete len:88 (+) Transcript_8916:1158-1421(+)